jgi:hypothetical protein
MSKELVKTSYLLALIEGNKIYNGTYWELENNGVVIVEDGCTPNRVYLEKGALLKVRDGRLTFPHPGGADLNVFLHSQATFSRIDEVWVNCTFMEAIEAFQEGKRIKSRDILKGIELNYNTGSDSDPSIAMSTVLRHEWYIWKKVR